MCSEAGLETCFDALARVLKTVSFAPRQRLFIALTAMTQSFEMEATSEISPRTFAVQLDFSPSWFLNATSVPAKIKERLRGTYAAKQLIVVGR
jgi:hypothetical protein